MLNGNYKNGGSVDYKGAVEVMDNTPPLDGPVDYRNGEDAPADSDTATQSAGEGEGEAPPDDVMQPASER